MIKHTIPQLIPSSDPSSTHGNPIHSSLPECMRLDYKDHSDSDSCIQNVILNESSKKSSWFASYINLTSTIIGSSVLGFPYAFSKVGWILGSILLVLGFIMTAVSLHLLSICILRVGLPSSYYKLSDKCFPSSFSYFIDLAVLLKCFGAATSYFIIIGDLVPFAMSNLLSQYAILSNRFFWILLTFLIEIPLCFHHQLHVLKWPSLISIGFLIILTIIVILYSSNLSSFDPCFNLTVEECKGETNNYVMTYQSIKCLSIFIFGYTCQHNTFAIVNEQKNVSQYKLDSIFISSSSTAFIIYSIIAVCGYSTYGSLVQSDFLDSYPDTNIINIARICISIIAAFHYPLQCNPARRSSLAILNKFLNDNGINNSKYDNMKFIFVTCVFLALSFITACSVSNLGIVFSLIGATGSTMVSLILPGLFYYTLHQHDGEPWKRYVALGQFMFGLIFMPVAVSLIFIYN